MSFQRVFRVLVLPAALVFGACIGEIGPAGSSTSGSSSSSGSACTATSLDPPTDEPVSTCAEPVKPCPMYRIQLQGDPTNIAADRAKYKAAFGSACYVAAANNAFNCYFKDLETACKQGLRVPEVYGALPYSDKYDTECHEVGNGLFERQVGPDPANKMYVYFENAPVETSLIDVDAGAPLEVNGPYRNLPQLTTVKAGGDFDCSTGLPGPNGGTLEQREWILQVNRNANGGKIRSDLAGFTWHCEDKCGKPTICTEPEFLKAGPSNDPEAAQVHHVQRRKDLRRCDWGTNGNSNAAVISRKLNRFLWYKYPSKEEVEQINKVLPYTYTP